MKFISNISEKTGLQENIILGILLIFSSVVLYFIYKKMNKKKENFGGEHRYIRKKLISDSTTMNSIRDDLKDWCVKKNLHENRRPLCKDSFNMGKYYDGSTNCSSCFNKCHD